MKNKDFDYSLFKIMGERCLNAIASELSSLGISAGLDICDHLCFRVRTINEYEYYKYELMRHGMLITEAMVNGRSICTFKLYEPFTSGKHTVSLLELPSPKAGAHYDVGFEHAEFVIAECFDRLKARFPHLKFVVGGNKNINPELCLKLNNGLQAKFHSVSLDRIIEIEEADITDVIFDLDGTLIKSRENIYEINHLVFSEILDREVSLEESKKNYHSEFEKLFETFSVSCPMKKKLAINRWGQISTKLNYNLFDNVNDILNLLVDKKINLHLWTARDEFSARKILQYHGIENKFKTLSFSTENDSKPDPKNLKFDWNNADKNSFLVIGDSPSDMLGSQKINGIAAAALWDLDVQKHLLIRSGAELLFYSTQEFYQWLEENI